MTRKVSPCTNMECKAYNTKYEFNCEINGFTFYTSFCKNYKPESATGQKIDDIMKEE